MGVKRKNFVFKKETKYEKPRMLRKFKEEELISKKMGVRVGAVTNIQPVTTAGYFN